MNLFLAFALIIVTFIIAFLALLWGFSAFWSILAGAPPVGTPLDEIYWILKLAEPKNGEVLLDLGCGDGRVLVMGVRLFDLQGIGYESAPWGNLVTRFRIWDDGLGKKIKIITKNIYQAKLDQADIIYLYLFPKMLKKLSGKFVKHLRPGSRIVSYAFPIPGWKANKVVDSRHNPKVKIYLYQIK